MMDGMMRRERSLSSHSIRINDDAVEVRKTVDECIPMGCRIAANANSEYYYYSIIVER